MAREPRKFYSYRSNADGTDWLKDARPYCTKGAAFGGVSRYHRTVQMTSEEQLARHVMFPDRMHPSWRYRTSAELKAYVAANFTLIEYELREIGPV
jgi:hypothetical protein